MIMTFLLVCIMQVKSASVMADQFPYYIYTSTSKDQDMEAYEEYKFYENNDFNRNKYLNSDVNNKNSKYKQIISTKKNSYHLAYGTKPFELGAKASGGGKLTYRSSRSSVATVSSTGKVTLKGTGIAFIIIKAPATSKYHGVTKRIKVTVGKKSIRLSKSSLTMSLTGVHTYTLKATTKYTSSKITWKSSNTRVAKVDKNGKITVKGVGTSKITAKVDGITAACNLTVKDTAEKTIKLNFSTYDEWQKSISKEENNLIFGGKYATLPNGTKYYAGNIIVKRKVLSYKTVKMKIYKTGPKNNNYITIYLRLPKEINYTLHRHNLKNNVSSSSVGKLMVGLVDKKLVLTQKCSCGFKNTLTWESPLNAPKKLSGGETYTVVTTSLMID